MSHTPTNLAGVIGMGFLAGFSLLGMLVFGFFGMVFHEAFAVAAICLCIFALSAYRLSQAARQ